MCVGVTHALPARHTAYEQFSNLSFTGSPSLSCVRKEREKYNDKGKQSHPETWRLYSVFELCVSLYFPLNQNKKLF